MRKVMILTASTGGGHNQAANSLEAIYKAHGNEVVIVDFLKVTGKAVEKLVIGGYSIICSNMPYIYKGLYKYYNNKELDSGISNYGLKIFEKKIYKKIIKESPVLIVGTHAFIVEIICKLKKKENLSIPFISVITDFKAHRFHMNSCVDAYLTANEYTKLDMIKRGVREEKIYAHGIPIKKEFLKKNNNQEQKANKAFTILLMGGSNGSKRIETVLKELINCKNAIRVIVVCGINKVLMNSIKSKYPARIGNKEIILYGFTNEIPKLMKESNLIISKPGGLTVSEAIVSNIPMLIPYMIPGQEEENAAFLVESGGAKIINNMNSLKKEVDYLIDRPYVLNTMKLNMQKLSTNYTLDNIVKISDRLINKYLNRQII
ncbi:MGDG synthase family glycosyltransferase [Paramaledivibacter caminithermalis]|uniref:Processive 1,2-diacylglycerol beta-glucosyltransferase n=1 Tax=Paramaledivibacter caminithermalis (strain DSM 15212 / CIP 107654 / DViRD3) TaxID=1121301 RepID=A0A1M6JKB3_PARC5|nr:glycosyltransferase [Paramaledivibacter caminithermalis]SHJ47109.1 processive 1,2-diacylglycerol beta-glucosyltransferase [Paramaledivibacter caminithermalis DSM 15212]